MLNKKNNIYELPLTIVLVQDPESKGYTVFSKQFPNIIAEGDDEDSAIDNLFETMRVAFKDQAAEKNDLFESEYKISEKQISLTAFDIV